MTPKQVVLGFWDAMRSNDFAKASGMASRRF